MAGEFPFLFMRGHPFDDFEYGVEFSAGENFVIRNIERMLQNREMCELLMGNG